MPIEATTLTPPPKTQELLQSLQDFRTVLPISETTKNEVIRSLRHPNSSAQRVARAAAQDPALSLQLILSANQLLARQGLESKYLSHSISLMGLPKVEQIVRSSPVYSNNPGYEEQLNQSWIAAELTRRLQISATPDEQEKLFYSCLAVRFHELALWSQYPHKMEQIERLKANPVYDHEQIETRLLGSSLNDLGKKLAAHWPLPAETRQCWREGFILTPGHGESINTTNCLKLCHVVSSLGSRNWYHEETLSAQQMLADEARVSPSIIVKHSHEACVDAPFIGWKLHPGARLLMHWDHQKHLTPLFWEAAETTSAPAPKRRTHQASDKRVTDSQPDVYRAPSELENRLNRLSYRGSSFSDLNDLLLFSLETLDQTLSANQAIIMILSSDRSQLRFQYCIGANGLTGKRIELKQNQTALFQELLQRPSSLRVNSDNVHECIAKLSPRLASIFAAEGSALMSLFHNRQALGLMFINKPGLGASDFTDFKKLGNATNSAIAEVARTRHRRAL